MRRITVCILLVVASLSGAAQERKHEVSLIGGAAMMDMNPGEYGVAANLQYGHTSHPWFGAEVRLGLVHYNDFPAASNYGDGDGGWGVSNELDAYIRTVPGSKAYFVSWSNANFYAVDASVFVSPLHTPHHRVKLYAGITRQHRATTELLLASFSSRLDDDTIVDYTPGYIVVNISEWGKHYGIAYQYLLPNDWSVGATVKLTYLNLIVTRGDSDHALFGLTVGKSF